MKTFKKGDPITTPFSDTAWQVRDVRWVPDTGDLIVGLVDSTNPHHGTAFTAAVLAGLGCLPE